MAQVKIYGLREHLEAHRQAISDAIHRAAMDSLGLPASKRFHRFFPMDTENFLFPDDRSAAYTIIEFALFEGRSPQTKSVLIQGVFQQLGELGVSPQDVEITLFETPKANWGIRGHCGDKLELNYSVEV